MWRAWARYKPSSTRAVCERDKVHSGRRQKAWIGFLRRLRIVTQLRLVYASACAGHGDHRRLLQSQPALQRWCLSREITASVPSHQQMGLGSVLP